MIGLFIGWGIAAAYIALLEIVIYARRRRAYNARIQRRLKDLGLSAKDSR